MRMTFPFFSWESRGENPVHGVEEHHMSDAKSDPLLAVQAVGKRNRDDTRYVPTTQQDSHPLVKRQKTATMGISASVPSKGDDPQRNLNSYNGTVSMDATTQAIVGDTVQSQMLLEILLTHNELRVIDQNLAKAQAAFEQLRRCHLIPYPLSQGTPDAMLNIRAGAGPALSSAQVGDARPQWAAPYGVTDGPYSRHYAKWLIPDPKFDGLHPESGWEKARLGRLTSEGRATRHGTDFLTPGAKARAQRGSVGHKLQALPSGYTPSKGPAGPSILKRPDGQLVKLVCLDCRREDFGSTQGFINHCRIAHKREFKSHEEAAVQSGVPVELDDVGGIVGEEKASPVPAATGLVHPLIRNANPDSASYAAVLSRISQALNKYNQGKLPGVTSIPGQNTPQPAHTSTSSDVEVVPCPEVPNLSNYLQINALSGKKNAFTGNVGDEVSEAKKRVDFADDFSEDSDVDNNLEVRGKVGSDSPSESPVPMMRMQGRAAMSPAPFARPSSSKGPESKFSRKPTGHTIGISPRLPYATPINTTTTINRKRPDSHIASSPSDHSSDEEAENDMPMLDAPTIHDLSPNTITSNNAPSLVSDDGEYDEGEDDAESSIDGSEVEEEGSDVAEIDFEDGDGEDKVLPATALRHRGTLRKEDKHVTFVSPVKERRAKSRSG